MYIVYLNARKYFFKSNILAPKIFNMKQRIDETLDKGEVLFRVFFKGQTQFERSKPFHIRIPGVKCTWSKLTNYNLPELNLNFLF